MVSDRSRRMTTERTDLLVIGGGFFGTYLATRAARKGMRVLLAEAKDELLQAASLVNQARVHNGYHYPRSILTGVRSRSNFERFVKEFPDCVDGSFAHYYGIAREGGHITAQQFALFCDRIGAEYTEVGDPDRTIFDRDRIEAAFLVKEWAFNAEALRANMADRLKSSGVQVRLNCRVTGLASVGAEGIEATLSNGAKVHADMMLNCTYAELNGLIRSSGGKRTSAQTGIGGDRAASAAGGDGQHRVDDHGRPVLFQPAFSSAKCALALPCALFHARPLVRGGRSRVPQRSRTPGPTNARIACAAHDPRWCSLCQGTQKGNVDRFAVDGPYQAAR